MVGVLGIYVGEMALDRLGLDFFGIGEHHRDDFAVSSPDVVLAAIAARTDRIRLYAEQVVPRVRELLAEA